MRALFAAISLAVFAAAAWACLPDLEIPAPPAVCGDGFVDPDAGEECDPGAPVAPVASGDAGTPSVASTACVACRVACVVAGYSTFEDPATKHCYFQTGPFTSSTDAVSSCEQGGGHLVRLVSEAELTLVAGMASSDPFWIGIQRTAAGVWRPLETTPEPGYTGTCPGCFAQVDGGAIPPDPAEAVPDGPCVSGTKDLTEAWTESQCSAKKAFSRQTICEREPVGLRARACGSNVCLSILATETTKRYVVVANDGADGGLGANDAVMACASLGGELAILGSREEREQVGRELGAYFTGTSSTWIGLSDLNGTWGWDAPGGSAPPPWGVAEPAAVNASAGRAYLTVDATRVDSELAHAADATDAGGVRHAALCQIP